MTIQPPSPAYLGPAFHHSPGENKPVSRVVIHSTVSPTVRGGARSIAAYFRSSRAGGSAHYVVDPYETVQCVYDGVIAWHAPPNPHSLGVEMCDMPATGAAGLQRWDGEAHGLLLARTARLVARICCAYQVPIAWLGIADLEAGRHGITSHNNVSQTWHESTHWDPGAFPTDRFIELVQVRAQQLRAAAAK